MRKIGKISAMLFTALFAALVLMPMVNPVQGTIEPLIWIPPYAYEGYDSYYGANIIAYLNGSTVDVKIQVLNDYYSPYINVSAVSIVFDWGLNKTLDYTANPVKIDYGQTKFFDTSFTADLSQASNVWAHPYTVYVQIAFPLVTTWSRGYDYKFVVYSQDQKDARDMYNAYEAYSGALSPYAFRTTKGRLLATQAAYEATQGQTSLSTGNFTGAKAHYQTAVSLYDQAFAIEADKGVYMEDAQLNATTKTADAAMLEAQALMNQAYGYIIAGLGFVLIGIGVIVYSARKPKPVQS
jgi:hypothetical protein